MSDKRALSRSLGITTWNTADKVHEEPIDNFSSPGRAEGDVGSPSRIEKAVGPAQKVRLLEMMCFGLHLNVRILTSGQANKLIFEMSIQECQSLSKS